MKSCKSLAGCGDVRCNYAESYRNDYGDGKQMVLTSTLLMRVCVVMKITCCLLLVCFCLSTSVCPSVRMYQRGSN
jgi:hypothetical protein